MTALLTLSMHWLLAAVFAQALDHKLTTFSRFAAVFAAWRVVPAGLTHPAARLVVAAECLVVVTNLFAMRIGLVLAALLLATYAAGMAFNRARGRSFIDCGCGDEPVPLTVGLLVRNSLLVALALGALALEAFTATSAAGTAAPIGWSDLAQAMAAATGAFGIYRCADQLLANAHRFRQSGYSPA